MKSCLVTVAATLTLLNCAPKKASEVKATKEPATDTTAAMRELDPVLDALFPQRTVKKSTGKYVVPPAPQQFFTRFNCAVFAATELRSAPSGFDYANALNNFAVVNNEGAVLIDNKQTVERYVGRTEADGTISIPAEKNRVIAYWRGSMRGEKFSWSSFITYENRSDYAQNQKGQFANWYPDPQPPMKVPAEKVTEILAKFATAVDAALEESLVEVVNASVEAMAGNIDGREQGELNYKRRFAIEALSNTEAVGASCLGLQEGQIAGLAKLKDLVSRLQLAKWDRFNGEELTVRNLDDE